MAENSPIFVDSNYFIAFFNPRDTLHKRASEVSRILANENRGAIISNLVFAETITVLAQKRGKNTALAAGEYLLTNATRIIHLDQELQKNSWEIFQQVETKNISFVDCSILAVMRSEDIKVLLTFDRKDFQPLQKRFSFSLYG